MNSSEGLERQMVATLVVEPSFHGEIRHTLERVVVASGKVSYFVTVDGTKETGYCVRPVLSTYEVVDRSTDAVVKRLATLCLPPIQCPIVGLDGVTYTFEYQTRSLRWWGRLPNEWAELEDVLALFRSAGRPAF